MRVLPKLFLLLGSLIMIGAAQAQTRTISGTVLGPDNIGLQGVTVTENNGGATTSTDIDGHFNIAVSPGAERLLFSYVGMVPQDIRIAGNKTIRIQLRKDDAALSDVVVTGYSAQTKRSITGSVVNVTGEEIKNVPVTNVNQALQGKVPGLTVITDGSPRGNVFVRIRGIGTINGSDPLYIVDGVPTTGNLNLVNPSDIESISVLKDASAASIYGSRAANGVIIISTKKGKAGQKPTFSFDTYIGVSSVRKSAFPKMLNSEQWANSVFQSRKAGGIANPSHPQLGSGATPVIPDFISPVAAFNGDPNTTIETYDINTNQIMATNKIGTQWLDEILNPGMLQNYNIGVAGGGVNSRYAVSFGYLKREGSVILNSFERYNARVNSEFSMLNGRLKIGENVNIAYSQNHGKLGALAVYMANILPPLIPVKDIAGNFAGTRGGALALGTNFYNPVAYMTRGQYDLGRLIDLLGNVYVDLGILKDLTFKSNLGTQLGTNHSSSFEALAPELLASGTRNDLTEATTWGSTVTWANTLNYSKQFGIHNISVLAGTEMIRFRGQGFSARRTALFNADPAFRYLIGSSGTQSNVGVVPTYSNLFSLFGKVEYSLLDRYFVNGIIRRDGSSRFDEAHKYGVFPSVGAGWILSNESFWPKNKAISSIKFRAGYGETGNQSSAGQFAFASLYGANPTETGYDINATQTSIAEGFTVTARGNPDLRWESTTTFNVGTDIAFFEDKLNLTFEWYKRNTKDMLATGLLPGTAGAVPPPLVNIGKVNNTGFDASVGYNNRFGGLNFDATATIFAYKNKVINIDGNPNTFLASGTGPQGDNAARTQAGYPISSYYGKIVEGVIQEGPMAGNFKFKDINKDGVTDNNDKTFIGSPHPDFQYSFNLNLEYKHFFLTVFLRGSQGNKNWNWTRWLLDFDNRDNFNRSVRILDAWTPENKSNTLAQYNFATAGNNGVSSSYFVEDGSYLRIQNIQLGYTITKIRQLKDLRIYVQAQNLRTFTKYQGADPEIAGTNLALGIDNNYTTATYPIPRSFLLGLNIRF